MSKLNFPIHLPGGPGWRKPKTFKPWKKNALDGTKKVRLSRISSFGIERRFTAEYVKWQYFQFEVEGLTGVQPFMNEEFRNRHGITAGFFTISFERITHPDGTNTDLLSDGNELIPLDQFTKLVDDDKETKLFSRSLEDWKEVYEFVKKNYIKGEFRISTGLF